MVLRKPLARLSFAPLPLREFSGNSKLFPYHGSPEGGIGVGRQAAGCRLHTAQRAAGKSSSEEASKSDVRWPQATVYS